MVTTVTVAWRELCAGALRPRVGLPGPGTPGARATPGGWETGGARLRSGEGAGVTERT